MSGAATTLRGLDVSRWQGQINWQAVKDAGYDFVIIKATEGNGYTDPNFVANWDGARAVGLTPIAYHFMRPDLGNTAEAEVSWFLSQVNFLPGTGAMLDAESGNGDLLGFVLGWARNFESRAGFKPMLYSGRWFMDPHNLTGHPELGVYGIDLAAYDGDPNTAPGVPGWAVVAMKQFTDKGSVPGIAGDVDLDEFYGDATALAAYLKGGSIHQVSTITHLGPFPTPVSGSIVAPGDAYGWTDLLQGNLNKVGTFGVGSSVVYSEAVSVDGVWYDHIPGDWAIPDAQFNTGDRNDPNDTPDVEWAKQHAAPQPQPQPQPQPEPQPQPVVTPPAPAEVPTMEEFTALARRLEELSGNVSNLQRQVNDLEPLKDKVTALEALRDKVRAAIA